jgi:hypothetical protein
MSIRSPPGSKPQSDRAAIGLDSVNGAGTSPTILRERSSDETCAGAMVWWSSGLAVIPSSRRRYFGHKFGGLGVLSSRSGSGKLGGG